MATNTDDQGAATEGASTGFEASIEELGPCKKKLSITIAAERISDEFRQTYKKLGETVPVPGFRPGHVPRRLLEKKFGEEVEQDVRSALVPDAFEETMKSHDLIAIGEPELDVESITVSEGEPCTFEVTVEVRPTFELGEYKGVEVEAVPVEVTEEDVDRAIADVLRDRATLAPADGASQDRDLIVGDVSIVVDGDEIQSEENVHYSLPSEVLMGLRIKEAPEKLKGREVGDEETFTVVLPDDYKNEEMRGLEAEVRISIQDIKRLRVPELDDELAQELDFDDAEDLRDEVEEQVRRGKEREAESKLEDRVLDRIIENTPFDLPEGLVQKELERALRRAQVDMQMKGASEAEIAERLTVLRDESEERVKREFREALILEAIAEKERVFVTESEVRDQVTAIGAGYGRTYEDMLEYLEGQDQMGTLRARMREGKVREFVRTKAKITDNS
jgi:trigger factor